MLKALNAPSNRGSRRFTAPFTFFFLVLPFGISTGYMTVTLPFLLTKAGLSVATAGAIVAVGASANTFRFLWGPLTDLTLTLRRWYWIGLVASASTVLLLSWMPLRKEALGSISVVVISTQVAIGLIILPTGGLMAHTVREEQKGRAAGWTSAGTLGGTGFGGGAGVWLAAPWSVHAAATKYSVLSSAGNIPNAYMTAFDGWAHDRFRAGGMLVAESVVTVACILAGLAMLRWLKNGLPRRERHAGAFASGGPQADTIPLAQTE